MTDCKGCTYTKDRMCIQNNQWGNCNKMEILSDFRLAMEAAGVERARKGLPMWGPGEKELEAFCQPWRPRLEFATK